MAGTGAWSVLPLLLLLLLLREEKAQGGGIHCEAHDKTCTVSPWMSVWGDRQDCAFANVVYPRTEPELVQAVADAVRHGRKVKVTRGFPHSTPKLTCPGTTAGSVISTARYDASVVVDAGARTATVGAGAQLHHLLEALAEKELALPSVPVWSFLTVVGLASTAAHGSSLWPESPPLHDRIVSLRLVVPASAAEGYAKVLELGPGSDEELLAAARVSLGVLGAISQVTIRADSAFKRKLSFEKASDADLPDRVLSHSQESEFGEIFWFPSQRQAVFLHSARVPLATPGDDVYGMAAILPAFPEKVLAGRAVQEAAEESGDRSGICELAPELISLSWDTERKSPLVGLSHRIQTSQACTIRAPGGETYCLFDEPEIHWHETSFTLPASKVGDYVRDIAALRDRRPDSLCGLAFAYGLWFRYIPGPSRALLGESQDAVDVNALYFRTGKGKGAEPRLDQDVYDEIEQLAMVKYGGKPHWGKSNRFVSFLGTADKYGERMKRFVSVKKRLDPEGIFSSPWSEAVLGLAGGTQLNDLKPRCGLEGLCICQTDEHCKPSAGYFCRPGLVFSEARVCRFEAQRTGKDEL